MIKINKTLIYKNIINTVSVVKYLETFSNDIDILNKESFLEYEVNYFLNGKFIATDIKKMTSSFMIKNLLNHYHNIHNDEMKKINEIKTISDIDKYANDEKFINFISTASKNVDILIEKIIWIYTNDEEFIQNNIEKIKEMLFDKVSKMFFDELRPQAPQAPQDDKHENIDGAEAKTEKKIILPHEKLRSHVTLYEKYNLLGEISLRYFYQFQDRPNLVNKWILKDHNSGTFTKLSESMVKALFENYKLEYGEYPTRHLIYGYQNEDKTFYIHEDLLTGEEYGEKIENSDEN